MNELDKLRRIEKEWPSIAAGLSGLATPFRLADDGTLTIICSEAADAARIEQDATRIITSLAATLPSNLTLKALDPVADSQAILALAQAHLKLRDEVDRLDFELIDP